MTVKCRAGESPGARSRCQRHTPMHRLSGRRLWPGQMRHSTADQRTRYFCAWLGLASARPPPPARARREEYRLCPPPPSLQAPPGTLAGACNRFCCVAASITSTAPPGNCCTATPPSTSPAESCPSRARLAAPPSVRPVPRSTGPTPTSYPCRAEWRQGHSRDRRHPSVCVHHADRAIVRPCPRPPGERRPNPPLPSPSA